MKMKAIVGISKVCQKHNFSSALFSTVARYSETEGGIIPDSVTGNVRGPLTGKPHHDVAKDDDKTKDDEGTGATGYMSEKAKEGTAKAADTIIDAGEKVKETADDMWGTMKDTAHKIKDTVANDDSVNKADKVANANYEHTDSHVEDFRKHNSGYDLESD